MLAGSVLGACTTTPPAATWPQEQPLVASRAPGAPPRQSVRPLSGDPLEQAVATPLSDLGLVYAPIPPLLLAALKAPYAQPAAPSCEAIASEVRELDAVLGGDLDRAPDPHDPGLIERDPAAFVARAQDQTSEEHAQALRDAAKHEAVRAVEHAAQDVIPHRTWVRKLSGAERYSHDVAAAITAGIVRRAYLKGLGSALGCDYPAAPAKSPTG